MHPSPSIQPVAIVGAGPVGLTCALELARRGVRCTVLEAEPGLAAGSRAICVSRRSLEILQPLGAAEPFVREGLGWTEGRSFYRGREVFHLRMPHSEEERYLPMTNLQQSSMQGFLADLAARSPRIELRWQCRVTGLTQAGDHMVIEAETPAGSEAVRARYVVAADGARGTVRSLLGLRMRGTSYEGRYLIADIRMRSDSPTERRAWFDPPSHPGATVLMHKQPDDIWRVDCQLRDNEDEQAELEETRLRARIAAVLAMAGEHAPWQLQWHSLYKAHCLCLDDYRLGRVLFVGDAAHLVPIFGVRGLNSGFADAGNLGWKLAYVLGGRAPERLLDSYSEERRAATLDILAQAGKSTRFMTPPSRGYRLLRDAALSLALEEPFVRGLIDPRQSQPFDYRDSSLTTSNGAPLPNARLNGGFLLDALGADFTLVAVAARASAPAGVEIVSIPEGARHPRGAYLVRPDGHVCARWSEPPPPDRVEAAMRRALAQ